MPNAICLRCGKVKSRATACCKACAFDPREDKVALAKSILLSIDRYEDGTDRKRYAKELGAIGERISAGEQVPFDPQEVQRQVEIVDLGRSISWKHGVKGLAIVLLWLWPLWLIISVGMWLFFHG